MDVGTANPTPPGAAAGGPSVTVLLVVPQGTAHPDVVASAIAGTNPAWRTLALWCGDPQLCPAATTPWVTLPDESSAPWERSLVTLDQHRFEWARAAAAARLLLAEDSSHVVLMWVGAVAVLGDLAPLITDGAALAFVPHVLDSLPDDHCSPTETDLVAAGRFSTDIAVFARGSDAALEWLGERLGEADDVPLGHWLARCGERFGAHTVLDERIGAGPWRWPEAGSLLVDAPGFDHDQPWVLDPLLELAGRIGLVGHPDREAAMTLAAPQLLGSRAPLRLPGGIVVDATIRALVRAAKPAAPLSWSQPAAFRTWLESHYWLALHARRRDLASAFPAPVVQDEASYTDWTRHAFTNDVVPFLVRHRPIGGAHLTIDPVPATTGVNLVGYFTRESSLGDVGRRVLESLRAAPLPVTTIACERTASPRLVGAAPTDERVAYEASLAIVNADQFQALAHDHPDLFAATQRMIGYWFWELEEVPRAMRDAIRLVDEIWAGSQFVADAFAAVARVPVRHVPIPVPAPQPSERTRASFPQLAGVGKRLMFAVVLDHFSITERKNPVGAIDAFKRAFAPDEGPVLVVKTMNAMQRWPHHQRVVAAAGDRPDIVLWDEHLERADQMAFVRSADCLVSLHRSEGLGLHLAEAMWMGTPCIATRYSGNLDFMDDDCSMLIDAGRVRVTGGQGVYPETAMWADPDLDQAAAAMRRIATDPERRARLASAARARMAAQPGPAETGRMIAQLLSGER